MSSGNFTRLFLYVAAHGSKRRVVNMNLNTLLDAIKGKACAANIEGIVLGSCNVGTNIEDIKSAITACNTVWMMGYKGKVEWLSSTIIDLSVFESMMALAPGKLDDKDMIVKQFSMAIAKFNGKYMIARNDQCAWIKLEDAISLVVQPRGKGHKPALNGVSHGLDPPESSDVKPPRGILAIPLGAVSQFCSAELFSKWECGFKDNAVGMVGTEVGALFRFRRDIANSSGKLR
jgi:hypothetical protein